MSKESSRLELKFFQLQDDLTRVEEKIDRLIAFLKNSDEKQKDKSK